MKPSKWNRVVNFIGLTEKGELLLYGATGIVVLVVVAAFLGG